MGEPAIEEDEKLQLARDLVARLEAGREQDALDVIAQLAGFRDSLLFQEVGRLTRELHDAIKSFMMDARLAEIAESEMPDAAERLRHVIEMTEEAANTTLAAVEDAMPLAERLRADSQHLAESWSRFKARKMNVDDFRSMSRELEVFLEDTQANSQALHEKLSQVLMAQGYQDLTGQIIRKVIDLVGDVEAKLVELVRLSGTDTTPRQKGGTSSRDIKAEGPVVPGVDKADAVSGQDEVDDLLSSLGF
ncbi:MAG: protein phosphatase CheZ [Gammaproteobacteria bacterium]|nr:MAG: protein phosphatase CheZ [Gammaproteobacteria bacterium]